MKQMQIDKKYQIPIDSDDASIPKSVKVLKPVLFHEGNSYCCLLGPDPQEGIFGCGDTEQEALEDWDRNAKDRLLADEPGDNLAKDIADDFKFRPDELW